MPMLETTEDLADVLADWVGIYGAHDERWVPGRLCHVCWTMDLAARMRDAARNEARLAAVREETERIDALTKARLP